MAQTAPNALKSDRRRDRGPDRGPKGRPLDDRGVGEVRVLLGNRPRRPRPADRVPAPDPGQVSLHLGGAICGRSPRRCGCRRPKSTRWRRSTIISISSRKASPNPRRSRSGCAIRLPAWWRGRRSCSPRSPLPSIRPPSASCARLAWDVAPVRRPPGSAIAKSIARHVTACSPWRGRATPRSRWAEVQRACGLPGRGRLSAPEESARRRGHRRCADEHDCRPRACAASAVRASGRQRSGRSSGRSPGRA